MVFVHFLVVAACLGAWVLLGLVDERLGSPYLRFWLRGFRGGVHSLPVMDGRVMMRFTSAWCILPCLDAHACNNSDTFPNG